MRHDRRSAFSIWGVFTLFPLFTPFFDSTKRHFHCKNWLVVNVRSTALPAFMVSFASFAPFALFFDSAKWLFECK